MTTVFRAEDAPPASRLDYWRHVIHNTLVHMDMRFDDGPHFRSNLVAGTVGTLGVVVVDEDPGGVSRTRKHVRQSDPELYQIIVQARGHVIGEQAGRVTHLNPGDFALADLSRPFRCTHPARKAVCVTFPRALLPLPQVDVARLTSVRIEGDRGTGALISSLVLQLPDHLDDYDAQGGARLGVAILDLLTVALAARLDADAKVAPETHQRALLTRIYAFIHQHLGDPELSPGSIAAAHHISVRYLHKLFETQEATVAGWIRQRRLDRCRSDLLDPAKRARPVSAIAARWGFPNAASFSRTFRAVYGVAPGEYRVAHDQKR
jgi:AraC-like DNA-binding protein